MSEEQVPRLYPERIIRRALGSHPFDGRKCGCGYPLAGYIGGTAYGRWCNHLLHQIHESWKRAYRPPPRFESITQEV